MIKISYLIILFLSIFIIYFLVKSRKLIGEYFQVLDIPSKDKIHISTTPLIGSFGLVLFSIIIIFFLNVNNFSNSTIIKNKSNLRFEKCVKTYYDLLNELFKGD